MCWTGRPGHGTRTLLEACLVRYFYGLPNYRRTQYLIEENLTIQKVSGGC